MNEQALQNIYRDVVKNQDYRGSKEDFIALLSSDQAAFDDRFEWVNGEGYKGTKEQFAELVGVTMPVKKKEEEVEVVEDTTDTFVTPLGNIEINKRSELPLTEEEQLSISESFKENIQSKSLESDTPDVSQAREIVNAFTLESNELIDALTAQNLSDDIEAAELEKIFKRTETNSPLGMPTEEMYRLIEDGDNLAVDLAEEKRQTAIEKKKADEMKKFHEDNELAEFNAEAEQNRVKDLKELNNDLKTITTELINEDDNDSTIKILQDKFGKYDLTFTKKGGQVAVRKNDGSAEEVFDLDPLFGFETTGEGAISFLGRKTDIAQDMQNFIRNNANDPARVNEYNEKVDFVTKALQAQSMRDGERLNDDGTVSSHLMATFEEDGKFLVVPTLFPKDDDNQARFSNNWIELEGEAALKKAKERGEVIAFDTQEEADEFAKGSWKGVTTIDAEAQKFYSERGLDYLPLKESYNNYQSIRDEIDFIEEVDPSTSFKDLDPRLQLKYKDLYVNDELRPDIDEYLQGLKSKEDVLFDLATNNDVKKAREDFDVYLRKKEDALVNEAIEINKVVKPEIDKLQEYSLVRFGYAPMELYKAVNEKTTPQEIREMTALMEQQYSLDFERQNAAYVYENSTLYLSRMENKTIQGEFRDNLSGFTNEFSNGLKQGHASNAILQYTMGIDMIGGGDPDDLYSIANAIVSAMSSKNPEQSRTMAAWTQSKGFKEAWDVIASDPIEWTTQLASKSIGMMMPYGAQIIPMAGGKGAAIGAGYGAYGGNPVTVGAGALTGLGYGLRTGFAATTYAMEYTNSIIEVISEEGYDVYDPDSVVAALQDDNVWKKGGARGHARGIPIAIIDYLTMSLAGRIFQPANYVITKTGALKAGGLLVAERAVLDPTGEAIGETLAQANEIAFGTGRTELDFKEITAEAGGAFGNQGSAAAINIALLTSNKRRNQLIEDFTDPDFLATYNEASDTQIMNFINKMQKLGKIDESRAKSVSDVLSAKRDAQETLGDNVDADVMARMMRLKEAKSNLTSSLNRREVFGDLIKAISKEMSELALTRKLSENPVESIDPLQESKFDGSQFNRFKIGTSTYETPEQFKKAIDALKIDTEKGYNALMKNGFTIDANMELINELNDYIAAKKLGIELNIKPQEDANTKQETGEVASSQQEGPVQQMEEQVPGQNQESTGESQVEQKVEEVSPDNREIFDQQVDELEQEIDSKVDFRLKDDNVVEPNRDEVESITEKINELESDNVSVEIETQDSDVSVDVNELNSRTDTDLNETSLEVVDGVPTMFTISDQLTTGNVVNPNTGNTVDNLKGSVGFNGTTGNETFAWAGTTEKKANEMINKANSIYEANKPTFEEFWSKNPEYNGLVPVNVVKMSQDGIISNEAMFRVLADNLTKLPEENRVKALEALKKEIKSRRDTAAKKKPFNDIIKLLEADNIQSIDNVVAPEFINKLSLGARVNLMNIIGYGTVNKPGQTKKSGTVDARSTVTTALLENQDDSKRDLVSISSIAEIITDPQMKNVPEGSVVALVGVDVLNPEVLETNHPNYKYGAKGKSMGILNNPVSMEKAYPVAYKKAMGSLIEKESQGKKVTGKQLRTNQTGIGIGIPSKDYVGAYADTQSNINKLNNFLNLAFPGTTIFADTETFNTVMSSEGVMKYSRGKQTVYGVTVDGDIYINPDVHNSESELFNTAIHEMGHVWTDYIQTTEQGRKIYKRGATLVKKTEEYKRQLKKFDGNEKRAVDETMAILIGNKGETIANATLKSKFKEWLLGMWKYIQNQFKMSKDLSENEIQDMTLNTFIGTALADIFSGKEIELTDVQQKQLKNPEAAFKQGISPEQVVIRGREMGMPDNVIAEVLKRRNKLTVEQSNELLATSIPTAFANAKGGINVGEQIFKQVEVVRKGREKTSIGKFNKKEQRAARKKDLQDNELFKKQPIENQKAMFVAYDALAGTKANQEIQTEIDTILAEAKAIKKNEKVSKQLRNRFKNYIRRLIPSVDSLGKKDLNNILKSLAEVDTVNFVAEIGRVQEIARGIQEKQSKSIIQDIKKYVKKKTKTPRSNKKPKAGSVEYRGVEYFKVLDKMLNMSPEELAAKRQELISKEVEIEKALEREANLKENQDLTKADAVLLAEAEVFERYSNLEGKSPTELADIFNSIKEEAKQSRQKLLERRAKRAEQFKKVKEEADSSIKSNFPILFNEDGSARTRKELEDKRADWLKSLKEMGFIKSIMKVAEDVLLSPLIKNFRGGTNLTSLFRQYSDQFIKHSANLFNTLDGKRGKFFTKYFQRPLAAANFRRENGVRNTNKIIDDLAKDTGFKNYRQVLIELLKLDNIELKGKRGKFNNDQLMYIYTISQNSDVRKRLIEQGYSEEVLQQIEDHLGPKITDFAKKVVNYMSEDSYNSVNEIYLRNNDVNLDKIENYFPLATQGLETKKESIEEKGNLSERFAAQSPSSLKRRGSDGKIDESARFSTVLEDHIDDTERYKAYADIVPTFNRLLNLDSVKILLDETGTTKLTNDILNEAVNGPPKRSGSSRLTNTLVSGFTRYILGLKLWQIPKQMISFIEAFKNFRYKPKNKVIKAIDSVPVLGQLTVEAIDALTFVAQYVKAVGLTMLSKEGGVKTARRIAAGFENRLKEGITGKNLVELYSGIKEGQTISLFGGVYKAVAGKDFKSTVFTLPGGREVTGAEIQNSINGVVGAGTSIGDILGVMGYMAVYNQDIENGMSEEQATMRFVEYNLTQQSRRDMDRAGIQRAVTKNEGAIGDLIKTITMFGSTMYLQLNNVEIHSRNIIRGLLVKGESVQRRDVRGLALAYGAANAAFAAMANILLLTKGDEEDKLQAVEDVKKAAIGLTILYRLPLFGEAIEQLAYALGVDEKKYGRSQTGPVEPLKRLFSEVNNGLKDEDYLNAMKPLAEFYAGFQFEPIEGVVDMISGESDAETIAADILNVPKSQRPGYAKKRGAGGGKTPPMWMIEATGDKQLIKEMKELNKQKREAKKELNDLKKELRNQ